MTQEDKELLLKDLCARLPYGVILDYSFIEGKQRIHTKRPLTYRNIGTVALDEWHSNEEIFKPYLRPMSSMTEEEKKELINIRPYFTNKNNIVIGVQCNSFAQISECQEWLNAHHFDYRGLIPMGLALEAPEGMYNLNEK